MTDDPNDPLPTLGLIGMMCPMFDDAPWFRRSFGFSYLPIDWKGCAAIAVWLAVEVPFVILGNQVAADSPMWWFSAAGGFGTFLLFWAFVEWKIDDR